MPRRPRPVLPVLHQAIPEPHLPPRRRQAPRRHRVLHRRRTPHRHQVTRRRQAPVPRQALHQHPTFRRHKAPHRHLTLRPRKALHQHAALHRRQPPRLRNPHSLLFHLSRRCRPRQLQSPRQLRSPLLPVLRRQAPPHRRCPQQRFPRLRPIPYPAASPRANRVGRCERPPHQPHPPRKVVRQHKAQCRHNPTRQWLPLPHRAPNRPHQLRQPSYRTLRRVRRRWFTVLLHQLAQRHLHPRFPIRPALFHLRRA